VEEKEQNWKDNLNQASRNRFELVDIILNSFTPGKKCLWFNVVHGKGGHTPGEQVFCNTRYGVTGYTRAIQMNPALSGIKVINIFLTYMREHFTAHRVEHCNHCVSEKFRGEIDKVKKDKDIAEFLVEKSFHLSRLT